MDLWIRSQNREVLIPNPKLAIEEVNADCYIEDVSETDNYIILGSYKTKERALEVLDEIQERIINGDALKTLLNIQDKDAIRTIATEFEGKRADCVYQMPKE